MRIKNYNLISHGLFFLLKLGFVLFYKLATSTLISFITFYARPSINFLKLFLKLTNKVFMKTSLNKQLFFFNSTVIWLTTFRGELTTVLTQQDPRFSTTRPIPILGFLV